MKRILFVDDEPNLLDGIRNLLRKQRGKWEMVFAVGGAAALEEMEKGPFDVIISDMRMPGMDGVELLEQVKERYPGVVRLILSGHAEREAIIRSIPVAHQFLSKPCDVETLKGMIERTCALKDLLDHDGIRRLVGGMDKIPSTPTTFWELTRMIADPEASVAAIAKIIERDAAMSAKVLQLTNSGYFGLAQPVASVPRAVGYLGVDLLKGLALTAQVFSAMETVPPVAGFSIDQWQQRSLQTGRIAKAIVKDKEFAEEAFLAGLAHDIGHIILAIGLPEKLLEVLRETREVGAPLHLVEKQVMGMTHAEVGAYLLGMWGLPHRIVEAVAYHHSPGQVANATTQVLIAVHAANALLADATSAGEGVRPASLLDVELLDRLGLTAEIPKWQAIVAQDLQGEESVGSKPAALRTN